MSYLIGFDVTGTAELDTAAGSMESLAAATQQVDDAPDTLPLEVPDDLAGNIDDVNASLDTTQTSAEDANTKTGFLESTFGRVTAAAVFVGEAIDIVNQFVDIGTQLWDQYNAKQALTEQVTGAVSDALLEQSGALDIINNELQTLIENAATPSAVLNASVWQGIEAEQGAEEVEKLRTAMLDLGLGFDDLGSTIIAFEDQGAGAATALAQSTISADEFAAALDRVNAERPPIVPDLTVDVGEFTTLLGQAIETGDGFSEVIGALPEDLRPLALAFEDQITAIEQVNDAQENVDYATLIGQQLAAAESSEELRGILDQVRSELGPDASEFAVWQEYTSRLLEARDAATETEDAVTGATDAASEPIALDVETEAARTHLEEFKADLDAFDSTKALGATLTKISFDADTSPAETTVEDFTETERTADVNLEAHTEDADTAIEASTEARTLDVTLGLVNGAPFDEVIDNHTADRTIDVDLETRTVSLPSASQLVSQVTGGTGRIIVPLVGRWSTRIEGSRPS